MTYFTILYRIWPVHQKLGGDKGQDAPPLLFRNKQLFFLFFSCCGRLKIKVVDHIRLPKLFRIFSLFLFIFKSQCMLIPAEIYEFLVRLLTYELGVDSKKSFTAILRLRGAFSHDNVIVMNFI